MNKDLAFYSKILKYSSWNALATFFSRGILLISMMLTARILGKSEFGIVGILQSSIALFESVAAFGMGVTAAKHIAEYRRVANHKIPRIISFTNFSGLITGSLFTTILYVLSPWISTVYMNKPELSDNLRVAAFVLGFNTLANIQNGILIGFEDFKVIAIINFLLGIMTFIVIVGGAFLKGVSGVMYGLLIVSIFSCLLNTIFVFNRLAKEKIINRFEITAEEWLILWRFSIPAMLAGLMVAPISWFGATMLTEQPNGYALMGEFNAANQWFSILLFIPGVVTSTLLPMFASKTGKGDYLELRTMALKAAKLIIIVLLPLCILASLCSSEIMKIYGDEFDTGEHVLLGIILAAAFMSMQNLFGNVLASINRMWIHTFCNIIWACVYLAAAYYFIRLGLGASALSFAMAVSYFVKLFFTFALFLYFTSDKHKV